VQNSKKALKKKQIKNAKLQINQKQSKGSFRKTL
jgi:hypothetical protein